MATSLEQQNTAQQVANEVNASANIASGVVKKQVEESAAAVAEATKKGESDRMAMVTEDITALPPDEDVSVTKDPKSLEYQKALAEKYASDYDEMMANQGLLPAKEQYLTKDQPIRVGQYQGKTIGSVPIFAAPQLLVPLNIIKQRQDQLAKAAIARRKVANQVVKLLDVDVPEQFQKGMNEIRSELIEEYATLTGNRFDILMDMNSTLSRKFHDDVRQLRELQGTVKDIDKLAEDVLADFGKKEGKYYPERIVENALVVRTGGLNVRDLLTPAGSKQWRKASRALQGYTHMTDVMNVVVDKIEKNIAPLIDGTEALTADELTNIQDVYQIAKGGDLGKKRAFMQAISKHVNIKDISTAVDFVIDNENVYLGETPAEKNIARGEAYDYVNAMIADELSTTASIFDPERGRGTSITYNSPAKNTPHIDMRNRHEQKGAAAVTSAAGRAKLLFDPATGLPYSWAAKNVDNWSELWEPWATAMGGKLIGGTTGAAKIGVEFGGTAGKYDIPPRTMQIKKGVYKSPYAARYTHDIKGNSISQGLPALAALERLANADPKYLAPADKALYKFLTGEKYVDKDTATATYDRIKGDPNVEAEGGFENMVNQRPAQVTKQELVLTYRGSDIDAELIKTAYEKAYNLATGSAEEKKKAGDAAVAQILDQAIPVQRLHMKPLNIVEDLTTKEQEHMRVAKEKKVNIDLLVNGTSAEQQEERAKLPSEMEVQIYKNLLGRKKGDPSASKNRYQTSPDFANVGWYVDYSHGEDNAMLGLDGLLELSTEFNKQDPNAPYKGTELVGKKERL